MPDVFGFVNINKPLELTSHDVVYRVRRKLGIKRVGHAGTLDPLAEGVLIVCVGKATRLSEYVMASTKRYRARVLLGKETTTYDAEGDIVAERDTSHITRDNVANVLPQFVGAIEQLPPMYSAVKQGGRKLYELARAGETVERKPRSISITSIEIVAWNPPEIMLDVICGSGTYIRSLAHDIGQAVGVGGYLSGLIRTASGGFLVENAIPLDNFVESSDPTQYLITPADALADYPAITLSANQVDDVLHGRSIDGENVPAEEQFVMGFDAQGNFIAVLRSQHGKWRPHKVFSTP